MPRKLKKNADAETAETTDSLIITPEESQPATAAPAAPKKTARKKAAAAPPTEKAPARKKATAKTAKSKSAISFPALTDAETEAAAQAAETFDDAFETDSPSEVKAHAAETAQAQTAIAGKESDHRAQPEPRVYNDAEPTHLERLQKILAKAGVASRRHAEELITEGRVQVNGQVVTTLGSKADAQRDHIRVDGKLLHGAERLRYFVLNKPRGYVTTVSDPEGRDTVMGFFTKMNERLYPVGRLDYLSEGLLLMTNDGELANKLTRAASGVEKTYLVKVSGQPTEEQIFALSEGVTIDRGKPGEGRVQTAPARIRQVRSGDNPWFEVVLIEGRNRELRKMFEEIGHHVEKIRRVGYGPLVLDQEPGQFRELDPEELRLLRLAAEGKWKPKKLRTTAMLPREAGRSVDHEAAKRGGKRPFRAAAPRNDRGRNDRGEERRNLRGGDRRQTSPGERKAFPAGERSTPPRADARRPSASDAPREQRPPARGGFSQPRGERPAFGRNTRPAGSQDRGRAQRSGEIRGFSRPPRQEAGGTGRPAFRSDRPRTESGSNRGPARPFAGTRSPRPESTGASRPAFRSDRPRTESGSNRGPSRPFTGARPPRAESAGAGRPAFRTDRPRTGSGNSRGPGGKPGRPGGGSAAGGRGNQRRPPQNRRRP